MHDDQGQISFFWGRLAVVAIFLLVAAFAIQNVWHEVKASEELLNNAASEYEALKKMYPEQLQTLPQSTVRTKAFGAVIPQNAPIN